MKGTLRDSESLKVPFTASAPEVEIGEHLHEAATDMIDVGPGAFASQGVPKSRSRPL